MKGNEETVKDAKSVVTHNESHTQGKDIVNNAKTIKEAVEYYIIGNIEMNFWKRRGMLKG